MKDAIIVVDNVSMKFNLAKEKVDSIKEYIIRAFKGKLEHDEFWALSDVSFTVERGDVLGLIGLNGSGKSTMLKTIARVLKPTKGSVKVNGKVAPLIELGAGFDFDLTGKENIYLNGALLGRSKKMTDEILEEIIEFSELREFMDVPMKNYSSGMLSRLAFSIAIAGDADILIVDEVLAVGDFRYQEKCINRIKEMMAKGTTVLFVSHSIEQIEDICNKVVWLQAGKVHMQGPAKEICEIYKQS